MRARVVRIVSSLAILSAAAGALAACSGDDSDAPIVAGDDGGTDASGHGDTGAPHADGGVDAGGNEDAGVTSDAGDSGSAGDDAGDASDGGDAGDGGGATDAGDGGTASLVPGASILYGVLPDDTIVYADATGIWELRPFDATPIEIAPAPTYVKIVGSIVLLLSPLADDGGCAGAMRLRTWTPSRGATEITSLYEGGATASPDGATIAYTTLDATCTTRSLYVANADGSSPRALSEGWTSGAELTFGSNGTLVAQYGNRAEIYSGAGLTHEVTLSTEVVLSPSGAWAIAFARVDGDIERHLLRTSDGSVVATLSNVMQGIFDPTSASAIFERYDGTLVRIGTADPTYAKTELPGAYDVSGSPLAQTLAFSPDGRWCAYRGVVNDADANYGIYVAPLDGSATTTLALADVNPRAFSADSKYTIALSTTSSPVVIEAAPSAGGATIALTGATTVIPVRGSLVLTSSSSAALSLVDLSGAVPTRVVGASATSQIAIAPSGSFAAYIATDGLRVADLP